VRKYRVWPGRAQAGMDGYAVLLSSPAPFKPSRPVRPFNHSGVPVARSRARASTIARQRRVLSVMLSTLAVPLVVALATGWAAAWWAVVALLPVLCTYVASLVRARRQMAEREIDVAFFGPAGRVAYGLEEVFSGAGEHGPLERMAAGGGGSFR
jgi:hypothetical protein